MKNFKRYTVTSALPYANGPLHVGHIAGAYLPADIYVRYLRSKKKDVVFICGSDEHGVAITLRAKKEGLTPKTIVDKYHHLNQKSFKDFGISFDIFHRTSSELHHQTASDFFKKLYDKGVFISKESEQFYDGKHAQFLADRYIVGTCPKCNYENAYGDQCEKCGSSLSPEELINPKSILSGENPELKKTKHWYIPLDKYESWLKEWILTTHKNDWKTNVYGQCKSWIDQGLKPRAVTRDLSWGIPVPIPEAKDKVLYVWFDAPIGYISATKALTDKWELYWKNDETKLVHFIGKDNIVFHCIIFPILLKVHGEYILPDNVPANEFMNLEGDKISTSRNWAVWLDDFLNEFPDKKDVLRYVLCANSPENKDSEFTWKDFQDRNNNELVAILGNFINRTLVLIQKHFNNTVPPLTDIKEIDKKTLIELYKYPEKIGNAIENYRFREALAELMNLARLGNKYLADTEPWQQIKNDENRVKTILNICVQISSCLAVLMFPFLPLTAQKLSKLLNLDKTNWDDITKSKLLQEGHRLNTPELLFNKIDDDVIQKQIDKLKKDKIHTSNNINGKIKEAIDYNEFEKLDIRVGIIISAEKIKGTSKLLKLTIDVGIDKRTVVSGIAEFYKPEDIIESKVVILLNLVPRTIKGVKSEGMILMAENSQGELSFVSPVKEFEKGAVIK